MKRKKTKANSPIIRLVGLEAAAAAMSLAGSPAMAAPGDLDPSFGDVGRQSELAGYGTLWSVDVLDDDEVVFGGGDYYCYYNCYEQDFLGRLLPDGMPDAGFSAPALEATVIRDTAIQADGSVVGVGQVRRPDGVVKLQVFRVLTNGSLDPAFGLGGLVLVADTTDDTEVGHSVLVEPDGRIVVAGTRGSKQLLVARLLANGAPDPTFGVDGVFVWEPAQGAGTIASYATSPTQVTEAAGGGYRVMVHEWMNDPVDGHVRGCSVLGLSDTGALDAAFGNAGRVGPDWGVECSALKVDPDGRVLLGGARAAGIGGQIRRMLANGQADPAFQTTAVPDQLSTVTALALGLTGSIFVAGQDRAGQPRATIVRLLDNGTLDAQYGRGGAATIDLRTASQSRPVIYDMQARGGDALVVGGSYWIIRPFVARLLGDAAGGGPGVLSLQQDRVTVTEADGQAVLTVRRTGGSTGAVAVTYTARDTGTGSGNASAGQDYTALTGRLSWADGEVDEREIVVPIAADALAESPEFFEVVLDAPDGGAGLGMFRTGVDIAGDGYPAGRLTLGLPRGSVVSENGVAHFVVRRSDYYQGMVTATVRVAGGDATPGVDFVSPGTTGAWQDVLVTFQDGETEKEFDVPVLADKRNEKPESFTLELFAPTGGAALGSTTQATVRIEDTNRDSGGGSFGWLGGLLLGLGGGLRRRLLPSR